MANFNPQHVNNYAILLHVCTADLRLLEGMWKNPYLQPVYVPPVYMFFSQVRAHEIQKMNDILNLTFLARGLENKVTVYKLHD